MASSMVATSAPLRSQAIPSAPTVVRCFAGSGEVFDWELPKRHPLPIPYILEGGLRPHNFAQALAALSPFAMDLNSKVEIAPGGKDLDKIKASGKLTVAVYDDFAPFSGKSGGIDIDLAEALAKKLNSIDVEKLDKIIQNHTK